MKELNPLHARNMIFC